jgi:HEAT repeat protein/MFS family permease
MKRKLVNRVLNVLPSEWPRIILAWHLNLFLRAGFVIGWTVTVGMFINRIGIEALPYLFVMNALMIMIGSIIYANLLQKIKRPLLIVYTILMAGSLLLLSTLFTFSNDLIFFGIILLAQSILLSQLNILISLFTEDLFSPLESQRTFPLIATSETIGGILGGLTVGILSGFLPAYKFIYLWILAIFLIIPTLLTSHVYSQRMPIVKFQKEENLKRKLNIGTNVYKKMGIVLKKIRTAPFLQGIIVLVMLQFMLFTMIEFQYTKAVQQSVMEHESAAVEITRYIPDTNLQVSLLDMKPLTPSADANIEEFHVENEITKSLGLLMMIFSIGSFIVQIFFASRLIRNIGIIGTILLHPLVTLLNLFGMTLSFNFFTAAMGRSSFEITGKLFHNAYHSSYYAISETIRGYIKEFMDGFIKPLGAILAFVVIFGTQELMPENETLALNLIMIAIGVIMTLRLIRLKPQYTEVSYKNLETTNDLPTRLNAIEILTQKGHHFKSKQLLKYLRNKKEKTIIKVKIIEALRIINDPESIPNIIDCLKSNNHDIRLAAVEALEEFETLRKQGGKKFAFTRHRAIETVRDLFAEEKSADIRAAIIQLLAKIDHGDLIPFIIQTLKEGDAQTKQACIKACRRFEDANIIPYIQEYLDHKNQHVRAEAIVALWPFKEVQSTLEHYLDQMKKSKRKDSILGTLYILGEIKNDNEFPYIFKKLGSQDYEIRHQAARALSKMNHRASILHMADAWIEEPDKTKKFIKALSRPMKESIELLVHRKISHMINQIIEETGVDQLSDLNEETLEKLKNLYAIVDEHEEIHKIEQLIKSKKTSYSLIPDHAVAT